MNSGMAAENAYISPVVDFVLLAAFTLAVAFSMGVFLLVPA